MLSILERLLPVICLLLSNSFARYQPNPPNWPSGVYLFDPTDPASSQAIVDEAFANNGGDSPNLNGQWSDLRYAFLLIPGTHNINISIGYYTTVHGLGMVPEETSIYSVSVTDGSADYTTGALDNFWRSAENFAVTPSITYNQLTEPTMIWAVSQSCPLRRVQINGGLSLYEYTGGCCAGYSSGGYIGDVKVSTSIYAGSQQQFLLRNVDYDASFHDGAWNIIFVGTTGNIPLNNNTCYPYTSVSQTPVVAEKPFIYYNGNTLNYSIIVPHVEFNKVGAGTNWGGDYDEIDFGDVYIASPDYNDNAESINIRLENGNHVVFGPGIYNLTDPIVVTNDDTVLFGLGMATLTCGIQTGEPCIIVDDGVTGVRITGLLLQASENIYGTSSLLQFGTSLTSKSKWNKKRRKDIKNAKNWREYNGYHTIKDSGYNFIIDVFARVGGNNNVSQYQVSSDYMFEINMDDIVIDNTWLWRADHDIGGSVYNSSNPCYTGALINGDNVLAYGLKVEHTLRDLVQWNGDYGATYFFQSELPYDVTQQNFADQGYVAYRVSPDITSHEAYATGVYCYFRDHEVFVDQGISAPENTARFTTSTNRYLNGKGGIKHIINDEGIAVNSSNYQEYVCSYPTT